MNINILGIFLFLILVILPYGAEQLAYHRFVDNEKAVEHRKANKVIRGYDWAYVWDAAHFIMLVAAGFRFIGNHNTLLPLQWFGYFVFLVGVIIRLWSLRELGINYDAQLSIHPNHQVVTAGPYHLMRHPLHFGTTTQILGLAFLAPLWLGLPAALAAILVTLFYDHYEDGVLLQNLGESYRAYYIRTWDVTDLIFRKPPTGSRQ